jgi:hypothetical protein
MASSSSSSAAAATSRSMKRSIDSVEASKENVSPNKKANLEYTPFQMKIIDMFKSVDLVAPTQLLGKKIAINRSEN